MIRPVKVTVTGVQDGQPFTVEYTVEGTHVSHDMDITRRYVGNGTVEVTETHSVSWEVTKFEDGNW